MINGLLSKINNSGSKTLAWVLLLLFDVLVMYFYASGAPSYILIPVVVFNMAVITVLFSAAEKKIITSYLIQIEALMATVLGCNVLGRISDLLAYLTVALYLIFVYYFYKRVVRAQRS